MKTYEEGVIKGFSHNVKTVEELEERIDKAINFIQANYLKYQHRIDYKQHMQDYLNDVYKLLEILKGNEEE